MPHQLVAVYPFLISSLVSTSCVPPFPAQLPVLQCNSSLGLNTPAPRHIQPRPALFPKHPIPQLASMVSQTSSPPGSILCSLITTGDTPPPHPGSFRGLEDWPLTQKALPTPGLLGNRFQSKSVALGCGAGRAHFLFSEKPHPYPVREQHPAAGSFPSPKANIKQGMVLHACL